MVDVELLHIKFEYLFGVEAYALSQTYPEEQEVYYLYPSVLQVVDGKSISFLCLLAPVLPVSAVSKLFKFVTGGGDIVTEPFPGHLRIEGFMQRLSIETYSLVQFGLHFKELLQHGLKTSRCTSGRKTAKSVRDSNLKTKTAINYYSKIGFDASPGVKLPDRRWINEIKSRLRGRMREFEGLHRVRGTRVYGCGCLSNSLAASTISEMENGF